MGLFIQRAPVVYAFDTKELAEEKKVSMEKWLEQSTLADDQESYWWPMVYPDILCGKTLWLVTMVGYRGKDVPKKAKERERWLKNKVKELEAGRGCAAQNAVVPRSGAKKKGANTVPSSSSSTRKPKVQKNRGKKHVATKKTVRRK